MLIFQLSAQLVNLRLDVTERGIGFFDNGVIAGLWSARNEDILLTDRGQGIESRADPSDCCIDIIWITHESYFLQKGSAPLWVPARFTHFQDVSGTTSIPHM